VGAAGVLMMWYLGPDRREVPILYCCPLESWYVWELARFTPTSLVMSTCKRITSVAGRLFVHRRL